jgi:predicted permease
MVASFLYLERRDPGFRPDHVLTFEIRVPDAQYNVARQIAYADRLLERLRAIPGVQAAATSMPLPLTGHEMTVSFDIEERPKPPAERQRSDMAIVMPGYFAAMGIQLLKGRDFTERDTAGSAQVLVVNKAFADRFFPGEEALGKRVMSGATNGKAGMVMREIVGIVGNARQSALSTEPDSIYYFPYQQLSWGIGAIVLRTSGPPLAMESAVRDVVASLDKSVPVFRVRSMESLASTALEQPHFQTMLMSTFAAIALLLMVVGLYGSLAYSVTKRRREIGVRIALGATPTGVLGMVVRQAMTLVSTGLILGLAGASAGGRMIRAITFGITPTDPWLLAIECAVIVATSVAAIYIPATRAASVEPIEALREE